MGSKKSVPVKESRTVKLDQALDELLNNHGIQDIQALAVCELLADLDLVNHSELFSRDKNGTLTEHLAYTSTDRLQKLIINSECGGML